VAEVTFCVADVEIKKADSLITALAAANGYSVLTLLERYIYNCRHVDAAFEIGVSSKFCELFPLTKLKHLKVCPFN
jgi:hypothetical protein